MIIWQPALYTYLLSRGILRLYRARDGRRPATTNLSTPLRQAARGGYHTRAFYPTGQINRGSSGS